jgi:hypothetical protein
VSILNQALSFVIYDDADSSNNPLQRYANWQRNILTTISNPQTKKYVIPANSTSTIFSGVRATAIDGTSAFSIALNAYNSSVYRVTNTGGTAPAFRTDRALTLSGMTITVAINNNATATFTTSGGSFAAVQVGDVLFVPSTLTGDAALASPFSPVNGGFWSVLARTNTVLTVMRPTGVSFSAVAEAVALTANAQLQAFSSSGIQVNDTLEISAGFSVVTQKSFKVLNVTPSWVEFVSTDPLPLESGILPTASGMVFYTDAKRLVRIEVDQNAIARFNGDTGNTNRIDARTAGDIKSGFGYHEKWGTAWSLDIVNRSRTSSMTVIVFSGE